MPARGYPDAVDPERSAIDPTKPLSLACWLALFVALAAQSEQLAPPIMLKAGDAVAVEGRSYSSPVVNDFDHDGRLGVLIGNLRGYLSIANRPADDALTAEERVQDVEDKRLDFNNW